jgi:ribose transport system substrate-binding protein
MKSSKILAAAILMLLAGTFCLWAGGAGEKGGGKIKLGWYYPAPHPFGEACKKGAEGFAADNPNIEVKIQVGPDWNQDSMNTGVLALVAQGYKFMAAFPSDPSASNGLYSEVVKQGGAIVQYGASSIQPTPASFAVMTDVGYAAKIAAETVFKAVGGRGTIINVLELLEDPNTKIRKDSIYEVKEKYPDITLVDIANIRSEQEAIEKIEAAVSANMTNVKGAIVTGFVPTVALAKFLTDFEKRNGIHLRCVGIDDDPIILDAIEKGYLDGSIAQNPYGQGYLAMSILELMAKGYKPAKGAPYLINAGIVVLNKDNVRTYKEDLKKVTTQIKADLTVKYLSK